MNLHETRRVLDCQKFLRTYTYKGMMRRKLKVLASKLNGTRRARRCTKRALVLARRTSAPVRPLPDYSRSAALPAPAPGSRPKVPSGAGGAVADPNARRDSALNALQAGTPLAEKVKELVRLAREQGFLSNSDIHDALAEYDLAPEEISEIFAELRKLDVEIVEETDAESAKPAGSAMLEGATPETERLDILDDPVRMYMKQMGRVPLLTREQEVAICRRIEE